jgi:signal transduction histidine kinase
MQKKVAGRFGLSFTQEDQEALAREAMASAVRGATRTALMNFLSAALVAALAWTNGHPALAVVLLVLGSCASGWRATFRSRLYPRGPNPASMPRVRLEVTLNAALSGLMWATASSLLLPRLPAPEAAIYLVLLATALCTAVVHLSALRAVVETYVTVQLVCLAPFLVGSQASSQTVVMGAAALTITAYGLIMAGRHLARGILITAGRLARGHAARRLLARRRRGLARRRADLAMLESAEARSLFVAKVSHDLRTPLQIIASGTEILEMRAAKAAPALGVLDAARRIANASDRLIELAGELTDFLRWSSGSVPMRPAKFDLVQLALRLLEDLRYRAQAKGLVLAAEGETSALVTIDPTRLRTILINLLSNAIKYADNGRVVIVVRRLPTGRVWFCVSDQGPGLPEVVMRHLGRPWTTGESAIPREGFGLGLFIVYSLAAELALPMKVSSDSGGTRFEFELPEATG